MFSFVYLNDIAITLFVDYLIIAIIVLLARWFNCWIIIILVGTKYKTSGP